MALMLLKKQCDSVFVAWALSSRYRSWPMGRRLAGVEGNVHLQLHHKFSSRTILRSALLLLSSGQAAGS